MKLKLLLCSSAIILAGCSAEEFSSQDSKDIGMVSDQPIEITAGTGVLAQTRSLGSIGDLESSGNNKWYLNQELQILGLKRGAADLTDADNYYLSDETNFKNPLSVYTAAASTTSAIKWQRTGDVTKYYRLEGVYSFYGLHTDDAAITNVTSTATDWSEDVAFDGSQDIMVGTAKLSYDDKKAFINYLISSAKLSKTVDDYLNADGTLKAMTTTEETTINTEFNKAFSAYSSRRKITPNIYFEHQLTRLRFYVKAGDKAAAHANGDGIDTTVPTTAGTGDNVVVDPSETTTTTRKLKDGIFIKSVSVQENNAGNIKIDNANETISFTLYSDDAHKGTLALKQRSSTADANGLYQTESLTPTSAMYFTDGVTPVGDVTYKDGTQVGESVLVPGNRTSYNFLIKAVQYLDENGNMIIEKNEANKNVYFPEREYKSVNIQLSDNKVFLPGYSYNVYLTLSGAQIIKVDVTLAAWKPGDDINVSPDDM